MTDAGFDPFAEDFGTAAPPGGAAPNADPFAEDFQDMKLAPATSMLGAATRGAERSALPAFGSLPAIGAGAEAGAFLGPWGAVGGAVLGGLGAGYALSKAQDWALSKLPDSWVEKIGMSDRQQKLDEKYHGTASFLGGLAPYALTMRPGSWTKGAVELPENATALQQILAHPATAHVFGGAVTGGMELGQEAASGESPDWTKVAISTGFGVVFNQPTRIGQTLENWGARPARYAFGRPEPAAASPAAAPAPGAAPSNVVPLRPEAPAEAAAAPAGPPVTAQDWRKEITERTRTGRPYELPPTIADAADLKVMGPGITEDVFQGSHQQSEATEQSAREQKQVEASVIGPPPETDVRATARRMDVDLFDRYDRLQNQRAEFSRWAQEEPESTQAREHLAAVQKELAEVEPQVAAAHRRAAEATGAETVEPQAPPPSIEAQRDFIRNDVKRQLIAAGRPPEEAEAAGALIAARYETRANAFGGARGTPEELYRSEGAEILKPRQRAQQPQFRPAPVPRPEEKLSLVPFLARRGGISPDDPLASDLRGILGDRLFRKGGMTLDRAREAAAEAGYITNEGRGGIENRGGGTSTVRNLLDAISEESRGKRVYRPGMEPKMGPVEGREATPEDIEEANRPVEEEPESELMTDEDRAFLENELRQEVEPTEAPPALVHKLPYRERWGDPRFDPADRTRALDRLAEIAKMDVRKAPWADVVRAKRDIDEIFANLYFYKEDFPLERILQYSHETQHYFGERERGIPLDEEKTSSIISGKSNPEDLVDFEKAGLEAAERLITSRRKGITELMRAGHEKEPTGGTHPERIGETQRSGFYFPAGRKLADVPDNIFNQGGWAVINHLRQAGVSQAEIHHFGLDTKLGNVKPVTREQFADAIAERMFDFRRKTAWLNPERSPGEYDSGGTRAFTGPRVPGRGIYFERVMAFPKRLKGGEEFAPGNFESPHWQDFLKGAWASWRGSVRDVPGYGKMVLGEEGQSDFMQGASVGRRPRLSGEEYLKLKGERAQYEDVENKARTLIRSLPGEVQDLLPSTYRLGRSPEEWQERINNARDHILGDLQGETDVNALLGKLSGDKSKDLWALGQLDDLRRKNEKFFAADAQDKYQQLESSFTPESPIDQSYVRTMARDLLLHAAKENADSIAISTSDTTSRIQANEGAAHFYDQQLKPALERELRRLTGDGSITLEKVDLPKAMGGRREKPYTVWAAKLPEEAKEAARSGLPLFQRARGGVVLNPRGEPGRHWLGVEDVNPIMRLTKDANASTFIHESGHQFLGELMRDAEHEAAPDQLKADAQTTLKWLGIDKPENLTRKAHEKFATGFEQYLREGTAPSAGLARVFAQFKQWLVKIYQTIKGLGQPINEDIRQVFDRMLVAEPQPTVIAPEQKAPTPHTEEWRADTRQIEPEHADASEARIAREQESRYAEIPHDKLAELQAEDAVFYAEHEPASDLGGEDGEGAGGPQAVELDRGATGAQPGGGVGGAGANGGVAGPRPSAGESAALPRQRPASEGPGGERAHLGDLPLAPNGAASFARPDSFNVGKDGNVRAENITSVEQFRQAINESSERIGGGDAITMGDMNALADDLSIDPKTIDAAKLAGIFGGVKDLAAKVWAFRKAIAQSAEIVHNAMQKVRDTGTDEAVAEFARVAARHDMMQSILSSVTTETGRALGMGFRNLDNWKSAQDLGELVKGATGKTLFQLKQIATLGAALKSPALVSKYLRDAQKRAFGAMILEYWVNGLISGPATHITYIIGNQLLAIQKAVPETLIAAAIGSARAATGRAGPRVYAGESVAGLKGMVGSLPAATQAFVEALHTGQTTLLPGETAHPLMPFQGDTMLHVARSLTNDPVTWREAGAEMFGMFRGMRDAVVATAELVKAGGEPGAPLVGLNYSPLGQIPDIAYRGATVLPVGSVLRLPGRSVAAIHSFFRTMNYLREGAAEAYRVATDARDAAGNPLTGNAFAAKIGEVRTNPSAEQMDRWRSGATQATLMGEGGAFVKAVSRLMNTTVDLPVLGRTAPLKFVDPFVTIGANVINQSIVQRTPIGILSSEIRADLLGKNGNIAQDMAQARMLAGTAMGLVFGGLAMEGYATGSGPSDPAKAAAWRLGGYQPHSVRIGDLWYQVNRLGPIGMLMSTTADLYDVAHDASQGDLLTAAAHLQHAITQNILDESFMRGPADLIKAVEDPGRYGEGYLRNMASSFVPFSVGMFQIARAADPYSRQARTIVDSIKQHVPGMSEQLFPRRDVWGQEIPNPEALGHAGLTAIYVTQISRDPVNRALLDLGIAPARVERKIRNVQLTDGQYDDYARIAGRLAKMRLDAIVNSPDWQTWPNYSKHSVIQEVIKQSRTVAEGMMFAKYPSIVRDAAEAQRQRKTGEPVPIH